MSTFIPVNLDEVQEQHAAPQGIYHLQITDAKEGQTGPNSQTPGAPQLIFTIGFADPDVDAPTIRHYVSLPHEGDDATKQANKLRMLKRFLVAFNIPYSSDGIDSEAICFEAIGKDADIEVLQGDPDASGNVYNRLNLPKLPRQ